jgi:hypothetical protein
MLNSIFLNLTFIPIIKVFPITTTLPSLMSLPDYNDVKEQNEERKEALSAAHEGLIMAAGVLAQTLVALESNAAYGLKMAISAFFQGQESLFQASAVVSSDTDSALDEKLVYLVNTQVGCVGTKLLEAYASCTLSMQ